MPSFLSAIFGSKPSVPNLPTLNLGAEQGKAIQSNNQNLPGMENLVGKANQFSFDQITSMLEQSVPGYSSMVKTLSGTIGSELKGEIPTDVSQQVQNSAAARAVGGGYGGSGAHGDLVARDLGITSLDLTQQGLSSMESWTSTAAQMYEPSMMNVTSMFVTPQQQASFDNQQNMDQFQRQWMQNQIDAMPDPVAKGIWDFTLGGIHDMIAGSAGATNWGAVGGAGGGAGAGAGAGAGSGASVETGIYGGELTAGGGAATTGATGGGL